MLGRDIAVDFSLEVVFLAGDVNCETLGWVRWRDIDEGNRTQRPWQDDEGWPQATKKHRLFLC